MKKLEFNISINASAKKVWSTLWNDASYREWTSVFSPGSHVKSNWNEGDRVLFLDGEGRGMYSVIDKKVPEKLMHFKHLGEVRNNQEMPIDEKTKEWSGSKENYELTEKDGKTELKVEVEVGESDASMMEKSFPPALQKLKGLAEAA